MDLFPHPRFGTEYKIGRQVALAPTRNTEPAPDNRYPAFAAQMQDGRLVTDYRNHCSRNVPAGAQFTTKKWMIHHADTIIAMSRQRQAEWTGAAIGLANTVPPPADIVHSTPFNNEVMPTNAPGGIGVMRADAAAPALFGTFKINPSEAETRYNKKNIATTTYYQGGRNSLRGGAVGDGLKLVRDV